MISFGWKRKLNNRLKRGSTDIKALYNECDDSSDDDSSAAKKNCRSLIALEDSISKATRLKNEGSMLAEHEKYWEAIGKFNNSIALNPADAAVHEMKAQALLAVGELFPAVQAAAEATKLDPTWWTAYQTLGRTQISFGEVDMAVLNFQRALHLKPDEEELKKDDLEWALSVQEEASKRER